MLHGLPIAVVVPAFNEEPLIAKTLQSVPAFVDEVVVVDDASTDDTVRAALSVHDARIRVIRLDRNRGVGAAIVAGYRAAAAKGAEVMAVMAGDAQMDPADLEGLVGRVSRGEADYAKGDRLHHPDVRDCMPAARRIVGGLLSKLTRWACGLEVLSDSQCGYTAISARALAMIPLDEVWPRYGYPNDLLGRLALAGARIVDVRVRPVYGTEKSGVRPWHVLTILRLLAAIASRRFVAGMRGSAIKRELRDRRALGSSAAHATDRSSGRSLDARVVP